jgi:hypothetical protein
MQVVKRLSGFCVLRSLLLIAILLAPISDRIAAAGVIVIGALSPSNPGGVSIGIDGIAFDGTPNALVIDRWSWDIERVSVQDASLIGSTTSTPVRTFYNSQLAYDSTTGDLYTVYTNQYLVRIAAGTYQNTIVGGGIGAFFNFVGLAADPSGNLWLATDDNGGELWSIDKQSGIGTLHTTVNVPVSSQITSMMIDSSNHFILSVLNNLDPVSFLSLDPNTGNTSLLTTSSTNTTVNAMAYDPVTQNYYGIQNSNTLIQIVGVPEPSGIVLAALGLIGVAVVGRQRALISFPYPRGC